MGLHLAYLVLKELILTHQVLPLGAHIALQVATQLISVLHHPLHACHVYQGLTLATIAQAYVYLVMLVHIQTYLALLNAFLVVVAHSLMWELMTPICVFLAPLGLMVPRLAQLCVLYVLQAHILIHQVHSFVLNVHIELTL